MGSTHGEVMANTLLCLGIAALAYAWSRLGFRLPGALRVPPRLPHRAVRVGGWAIILLVSAYSLGGVIGGRTQIARSPVVLYASRHTQPGLFWLQIAWQLGVGLLVGGALVRLSRAQGDPTLTSPAPPPASPPAR
jgi:hypothetical protein